MLSNSMWKWGPSAFSRAPGRQRARGVFELADVVAERSAAVRSQHQPDQLRQSEVAAARPSGAATRSFHRYHTRRAAAIQGTDRIRHLFGRQPRWSGQLSGEYRVKTHPDIWLGLRHWRFDFPRQLDHGYFNPKTFDATHLTGRLGWRPDGDTGRWDLAATAALGREHAVPDGSKPAYDLAWSRAGAWSTHPAGSPGATLQLAHRASAALRAPRSAWAWRGPGNGAGTARRARADHRLGQRSRHRRHRPAGRSRLPGPAGHARDLPAGAGGSSSARLLFRAWVQWICWQRCAPGALRPTGLLLVGSAQELASAATGAGRAASGAAVRLAGTGGVVQRMMRPLQAEPAQPDGIAQPHAPLPDEDAFLDWVATERLEQRAGRAPGDELRRSLRLDEFDRYRERLPRRVRTSLWRQVSQLALPDALADKNGRGPRRRPVVAAAFYVVSRCRKAAAGTQRAHCRAPVRPCRASHTAVAGHRLSRTAQRGQCRAGIHQAREAARHSGLHLELEPSLYRRSSPGVTAKPRHPGALMAWLGRFKTRHALLIQYVVTMALGLVVPFLVYWGLGSIGFDISDGVYMSVVAALVLTALSIWAEGFLALGAPIRRRSRRIAFPPASAIIAAYLPNEAPIIETRRAFLRVQYPAPLQVILAYNTPRDMPESRSGCSEIAREDPRFVPLRVARQHVEGAERQRGACASSTRRVRRHVRRRPPPGSRTASGAPGAGSPTARTWCRAIASSATAMPHGWPGWSRSNSSRSMPSATRAAPACTASASSAAATATGAPSCCARLRMHGFMLTEDIDSSMRAVVARPPDRLRSVPGLARAGARQPDGAHAKQRLRWAQGWFQVR